MPTVANLFHIDQLAIIMMLMVGFVAISVGSFSSRYLRGDAKYASFYIYLTLLLGSVFVMVCANHILVFLAAWGLSNTILVKLMIHKASWTAAYESGILAAKNFTFGFLMISAAFLLLYNASGKTNISEIVQFSYNDEALIPAVIFLLLGAMTQSAIWPFNLWLNSSLNSPTPVSAIMHAGLVNGGGFLLARFAPLYFELPVILTLIFMLGLTTALLGTLWKLMQSDVKRMLACSTMGQMGFMIAQCGLGLFPAAIAHLCWHGFFKAYLFLASGSAAQEKRIDLDYPPQFSVFTLSLLCGLLGSLAFALTSHKNIYPADTNLILNVITMIAGAQLSIPILRAGGLINLSCAIVATSCIGGLYGTSILLVEKVIAPLNLMHAQPLNIIHILSLLVLIISWVTMLFYRPDNSKQKPNDWLIKFYVSMLNASQPHKKTVTAHRNYYKYL